MSEMEKAAGEISFIGVFVELHTGAHFQSYEVWITVNSRALSSTEKKIRWGYKCCSIDIETCKIE